MEWKMVLFPVLSLVLSLTEGRKKIFYVHWNRANPIFLSSNSDHILKVNENNKPWEYDQVNIICPVTKPGHSARYPETHVVYSVSKEEYETCRITNPNPKIVAVCDSPYRLIYFTLTFRSFTPTPGGLEFKPGKDYYFISTSSATDLRRRVGGGCATRNMKMIFKVAGGRNEEEAPRRLAPPSPSRKYPFPGDRLFYDNDFEFRPLRKESEDWRDNLIEDSPKEIALELKGNGSNAIGISLTLIVSLSVFAALF